MSEKYRSANSPTQFMKELRGGSDEDRDQFESMANNRSTTLPKSAARKSLKQPLIKQASLNNPPIYFQNLNSDFFQDEASLYENNSTSNQELRKATSSFLVKNNQNNLNSEGYSSTSIAKHSRASLQRQKSERLQDPMLMFKNRNSSTNSTSRLNISTSDLADASVDECALYDREKNLNRQQQNHSQLNNPNDASTINMPAESSSRSNFPVSQKSQMENTFQNSIDLATNSSNELENPKEIAINQLFRYIQR